MGCTATIAKGGRKGQVCGEKTKEGFDFCYRHVKVVGTADRYGAKKKWESNEYAVLFEMAKGSKYNRRPSDSDIERELNDLKVYSYMRKNNPNTLLRLKEVYREGPSPQSSEKSKSLTTEKSEPHGQTMLNATSDEAQGIATPEKDGREGLSILDTLVGKIEVLTQQVRGLKMEVEQLRKDRQFRNIGENCRQTLPYNLYTRSRVNPRICNNSSSRTGSKQTDKSNSLCRKVSPDTLRRRIG